MSSPRNNNNAKAITKAIVTLVVAAFVLHAVLHRSGQPMSVSPARVDTPVENPIVKALKPPQGVAQRNGIGVAVLIDTSGSMTESVGSSGSARRPKLAIAQECLAGLAKQMEQYAQQHPDQRIEVGFYEFSGRGGSAPCRSILAFGAPNAQALQNAAAKLTASGDTPIGDAMLQAKQDLDRTGLSHQHILVITDGENNRGYALPDVVTALANQDPEHRAAMYFVAFDIAGEKFAPVRQAGGTVLHAGNGPELRQTLDYVLSGKILAEAPATPASPAKP